MEEGKLLGHIISKDDIHIDPAKVQAIQQSHFLSNKKEIHSFNGKIKFLRRFIHKLAEHLKEMIDMLKEDNKVKWSLDAKKSFHVVKFSLSTAPSLISLDYTLDFIIFSFAFENTLAVVIIQKKYQKNEKPICSLVEQ